jgi:hypothetical protein
LIPDAEHLAVAWAKADDDLAALLEGRVATRLPRGWVSPFLRVIMVDGERDREADVGNALLQWDVYAKTNKPTPDFVTASLVARTLIDKMEAFSGAVDAEHVYGFSQFSGPSRVEEEGEAATQWARYRVDCLMTLRRGVN